MDDITGYNELRGKLCNVIASINEMNDVSFEHRTQLLEVFDKIVDEITTFRYNMFKYIPDTVLFSSTPGRSPVFLTSPFQLS